MCSVGGKSIISNPLDAVATVATGGVYAAAKGASNAMTAPLRDAANAQKEAIAAQTARDAQAKADAKAQADAIGAAAKRTSLDQAAIDEMRRKQLALQNGIAGTVTSNGLSSAPAAQTLKATLGA